MPHTDAVDPPTGLERIRQNRDDLEDLADSDLPVSDITQTLLNIADDANGERSV